ncbi:hypothetical protein AK830_g12617, partial [Neonectria ditissima]
VVFDFAARIGSTVEAHRLVVLARRYGCEHALVQETMRMYFEGGGDITSTEHLVQAAERVGIDAAEARAWLEGDEGLEQVQLEVDEAVKMGVRGVPRFIINDKFVVDGADDVSVFLEQLVLAREDRLGEGSEGWGASVGGWVGMVGKQSLDIREAAVCSFLCIGMLIH